MECVLAITLILAMFGHSVDAEKNCYTCVFNDGLDELGSSVELVGFVGDIPDVCTDTNFNASSPYVTETPCETQCKIVSSDIQGVQTFLRACDEEGLCSSGFIIEGIDITCCDGDLCNGPNGAGLASVNPVVILATTVLSALLLLVS